MGDSANLLSTTFLVPPDPPFPIGATYSVGTSNLTVTFSELLQPGLSAAQNWYHTTKNGPPVVLWNAIPATIAGNTVTAKMAAGIPPGPLTGTCRYDPPPFDVLSLRGVPAAAFNNYPVVNVP